MKIDWHSIVNFVGLNTILVFVLDFYKLGSFGLTLLISFLVSLVWPWPMIKKEDLD